MNYFDLEFTLFVRYSFASNDGTLVKNLTLFKFDNLSSKFMAVFLEGKKMIEGGSQMLECYIMRDTSPSL